MLIKRVFIKSLLAVVLGIFSIGAYGLWEFEKLGILENYQFVLSKQHDIERMALRAEEALNAYSELKKRPDQALLKLEQIQDQGIGVATVLLYTHEKIQLISVHGDSNHSKQELVNIIGRGVSSASGDELLPILELAEREGRYLGLNKDKVESLKISRIRIENDPQYLRYHIRKIKDAGAPDSFLLGAFI